MGKLQYIDNKNRPEKVHTISLTKTKEQKYDLKNMLSKHLPAEFGFFMEASALFQKLLISIKVCLILRLDEGVVFLKIFYF